MRMIKENRIRIVDPPATNAAGIVTDCLCLAHGRKPLGGAKDQFFGMAVGYTKFTANRDAKMSKEPSGRRNESGSWTCFFLSRTAVERFLVPFSAWSESALISCELTSGPINYGDILPRRKPGGFSVNRSLAAPRLAAEGSIRALVFP